MAILIDENTTVVIQGITGGIGKLVTEHMLHSGTKILAGVTPGKGGQAVLGVPVFNSVGEAKAEHPSLNTSLVVVPPLAAKAAVFEAIEAGIKILCVFTETIPVHDEAAMIEKARENGCTLVDPASVGIISPGIGRIGAIGGYPDQVAMIYKPGPVGIISRSGGMTNETAWVVRQAGLGQSTVVGIGGEPLIGTGFADLLVRFEHDEQTKAVAMFGEIGGSYEEDIAQVLKEKKFTKPLVVYIAGAFAEHLPSDIQFGHAGAIISKGTGKQSHKIAVLKAAGAHIVRYHHELGPKVKELIGEQE